MRVAGSFSGIGGIEYGLSLAGHRTVYACEWDDFAREVYAFRFGHYPQGRDINAVRPEDVPEADLWAGGVPCFPKGTLILCKDGLKDITQVRVGDEVLTHENRWRRVSRTMNREAYTMTLKGMGHYGIRTTAEHPFLATKSRLVWDNSATWNGGRRGYVRVFSAPEWIDAWEMKGNYWATPVAFPTDGQVPSIEMRNAEKGLPANDTPEFFWFLGAWLGDGWLVTSKRPERGNGQTTVGNVKIVTPEGEDADELERRMKAAGLRVGRHKDSKESRLVKMNVASKPLVRWLKEHFGEYCDGKKVPSWLLTVREELRRAFFDGYIWADGSDDRRRGGLHYRATTINKNVALGIRLLANSLGYSVGWTRSQPKPTTVIEGRTVNQNPQFTLQFHSWSRKTRVFGGHRYAEVGLVQQNEGPMEPVFNLEVEEDNSYVADGLTVHNCTDVSSAGKRAGLHGGTRSGLIWTWLRLAAARRFEWILYENVPGLFSQSKGSDFHDLLITLDGMGYDAGWRTLDARYMGVPQRRRRVFLVARRREGRVGQTPPWVALDVVPASWERLWETHVPPRSWQTAGALCNGHVFEQRMDEWLPEAKIHTSLRDILETGPVDPKYFLSARACEGILRRAARRGRKLPPALEGALRGVATDYVPDVFGNLQSSPGGADDNDAQQGRLISGASGDEDEEQEVAPTLSASLGHHGRSSPRGDGADPLVPVGIPDPSYCLSATEYKGVRNLEGVNTFVVQGAFESTAGTRDPGFGPASPPLRIGSSIGIPSAPAVVLSFDEGGITAGINRCAVRPNDPAPTLNAGNAGRATIAYGVASDAIDRSGEGRSGTPGDRAGLGIVVDESPALRARHPNAVATIAYCDETAPTLTAPDPVRRVEDGRRQDGSRQDRIPVVGVAYGVALRGREGGSTAEVRANEAFALRASQGGGDKAFVAYQQHGSDIGPMGTLRAGHGDVQSGVPFLPVAFSTSGYGASVSPEAATLKASSDRLSNQVDGVLVPVQAYQRQGSNIGPMGTLVAGNGNVSGGVPFIINAAESCARESHAREADHARCLDQSGGFAANQGGTVVAWKESQSGVRVGDVHATLDANKGSRRQEGVLAFDTKQDGRDAGPHAPTLRAMGHQDSHLNGGGQVGVAFSIYPEGGQGANLRASQVDVSPALAASESERGVRIATRTAVRRLTPRECARLQGFPDDWTLIPWKGKLSPDSLRYKCYGNSVAVPVLRAIGERLMAIEAREAEEGLRR